MSRRVIMFCFMFEYHETRLQREGGVVVFPRSTPNDLKLMQLRRNCIQLGLKTKQNPEEDMRDLKCHFFSPPLLFVCTLISVNLHLRGPQI